MIKYIQGNLLDVTKGLIIHGCNAQGVMRSGVALAVREKYPEAYEAYKGFEARHGLRTGSVSQIKLAPTLYLANVVTQEFYGVNPNKRYVSYGAVHLGFERLHEHYPIEVTFNFPKIGAGLGNGDWNKLSELIEFACPGRELLCWKI